MTDTHHIQNAVLRLNFNNAERADQFNQQAHQWVNQTLLPSIEALFDQLCPADEVITIEHLLVDLGQITDNTSLIALCQRILDQLHQQLSRAIQSARPHIDSKTTPVTFPTTAPSNTEINRYPRRDYRWQQIWRFLQTGLPGWAFDTNQTLTQSGLVEELLADPVRLNQALDNSQVTDHIMSRLVGQLSVEELHNLLHILSPSLRMLLMTRLLSSNKQTDPTLQASLSDYWLAELQQALKAHHLSDIAKYWQALISKHAPSLLKALKQQAQDPKLPLLLVRSLTDAQRLTLLQQLEPTEYPFLHRLLSTSKIWQYPLSSSQPDPTPLSLTEAPVVSESGVHRQLWLFTLHYLLVERGSHFNKQQYMAGLLTQMAAWLNIRVSQLLQTLRNSIEKSSLNSTLQTELSQLLTSIEPILLPDTRVRKQHSPYYDDIEQRTQPSIDINQLLLTLQQGDEASLKQHWPHERHEFKTMLYWIGQLASVRRHWAERYSDSTLLDLTEVIEPKAHEVVSIVIGSTHLFTEQISITTSVPQISQASLRLSLWEFTLGFLLVERDSEFNRRSYLHFLTQQIAARRNVSHQHLLRSMIRALEPYSQHALLSEIEYLLKEYQLKTSITDERTRLPTHQNDSESSLFITDIALQAHDIPYPLINAIAYSAIKDWRAPFIALSHSAPKQLTLVLKALGQKISIRQHWASIEDESVLFVLLEMIDERALLVTKPILKRNSPLIQSMQESINPTYSIQQNALRQSLWEFTFTYLLIERGSEFNHFSYLDSLTEKLAARYNLKRQQLIQAWLHLCDELPEWGDNLRRMLIQQQTHSPLSAPELLIQVQCEQQSANLTSSQCKTLQHHLCSVSLAPSMAIQHWAPTARRRLFTLLSVEQIALLEEAMPMLNLILINLRLPIHWFYQSIFAPKPAKTPNDWIQAILSQLKKQQPSKTTEQLIEQLYELILESHLPMAQTWLAHLEWPQKAIQQLMNWIDTGKPRPNSNHIETLIQHKPHRLWQQLTHQLQAKESLNRWISGLSERQHLQLFAQNRPRLMVSLTTLLEAIKSKFGDTELIHHCFWQIIYHRVLLHGMQGHPSTFWQHTLTDMLHHTQLTSLFNEKESIADISTLKEMLSITLTPDGISSRQLSAVKPASLTAKESMTTSDNPTASSEKEADLSHLNSNKPISKRAKTPKGLDTDKPEVLSLYQAIEQTSPDSRMKKSKSILWQDPNEETPEITEPISVHNAGMVLLAPYIPMLFQRLGLTDGNVFVSANSQHQALFCLQYLVEQTVHAPEYQLTLNKVLCGIAIHAPIPDSVKLPEGASGMIEGLLKTVIDHWKALGSTSVDGLRSTFLQRNGQLTSQDKQWQLDVIQSTFDMLLDQLPWSYQTIKYAWMDKPLFVSWR